MNKAQEEYWNGMHLNPGAGLGSFARGQPAFEHYDRVIADQDAQIERLARRVADAEIELAQTLRILSAEQSQYLKLMNRLCDAMGTWVGPWDQAAVEAIKKSKGVSREG